MYISYFFWIYGIFDFLHHTNRLEICECRPHTGAGNPTQQSWRPRTNKLVRTVQRKDFIETAIGNTLVTRFFMSYANKGVRCLKQKLKLRCRKKKTSFKIAERELCGKRLVAVAQVLNVVAASTRCGCGLKRLLLLMLLLLLFPRMTS